MLLYKSGYVVGKYISPESKIAKNKNLYYQVLEECQNGWHKGEENVDAFIKYILQTVLAAYRDFEDRVDVVGEKMTATELVRRAVFQQYGKITKSDIMESCPTIGQKSVEVAIKKLVDEGVLTKKKNGRGAYYLRND